MLSFHAPKGAIFLHLPVRSLLGLAAAISAAESAPIVWNEAAPVKVACVGGSVTAGYWGDIVIQQNTYPDQLQRLLGDGYQVRNFGVSGATAGVYPGQEWRAFIHQGEQVGSVNWQADVIVGGLGVNDCFPSYANPALYEQGYRNLAAAWRAQGRNPAIWLWNRLTPDFRGAPGVPGYPGNVFGPQYTFPTSDDGHPAVRPVLQARIDTFAPDLGVETIDAYSQLSDKAAWGGDGLHLTAPGLKRLAEVIYCQAFQTRALSAMPVLSEVAPTPGAGALLDETGSSYPWVELHNPHPHAICLDGMALDTGDGSTRFTFSNMTVLGADERRIVFLSGKSLGDPAKNLHANFTVTGAEDRIRLVSRNGATEDLIGWRNWEAPGSLGRATPLKNQVVGTMSSHQRLVTSTPPAGWNMPGFDDSGWTSGSGGTGYELAEKAESQFSKRWDCSSQSTTSWNLQQPSAGVWSVQDGIATCRGTGGVASVPQWITGSDSSWTVEVRLRLTGSQEFLIRGGTQGVGGGNSHLYILPGRVVQGYPAVAGHVLSTDSNTDDFHTFRMAYHAPTRRFFVWRDGIEISSKASGNSPDASRYHWLTVGGAATTSPVDAVIDYASFDTSGAYRPEISNGFRPGPEPALPLVTDIATPAPGESDPTTLVRIPFNWEGNPTSGMKLKLEFDDGFRAWINGEEVARCNAPESGHVAPVNRDDAAAVSTVTLNLDQFTNLLTSGSNLLAVQAFNSGANDGRCFIRASLEISGTVSKSARYFFPPAAGQPNGAGTELPGEGWLIDDGGGILPFALDADEDGDGRSDLLEYAQGTNIHLMDEPPLLEQVEGRVNFSWRNNPEVGWRLMESHDLLVWRPAATAGDPEISPGSPGMRAISQPVVAGDGLSYRLAAVEQPTLANWRSRYFTLEEIGSGVITDPAADPDGDGLPNFLEFAIASDPGSFTPGLVFAEGRFIAFPDAGMDRGASWQLRSSTDLNGWESCPAPDLRCMVHPVSGRYLLLALDPELSTERGFQRIEFSREGL